MTLFDEGKSLMNSEIEIIGKFRELPDLPFLSEQEVYLKGETFYLLSDPTISFTPDEIMKLWQKGSFKPNNEGWGLTISKMASKKDSIEPISTPVNPPAEDVSPVTSTDSPPLPSPQPIMPIIPLASEDDIQFQGSLISTEEDISQDVTIDEESLQINSFGEDVYPLNQPLNLRDDSWKPEDVHPLVIPADVGIDSNPDSVLLSSVASEDTSVNEDFLPDSPIQYDSAISPSVPEGGSPGEEFQFLTPEVLPPVLFINPQDEPEEELLEIMPSSEIELSPPSESSIDIPALSENETQELRIIASELGEPVSIPSKDESDVLESSLADDNLFVNEIPTESPVLISETSDDTFSLGDMNELQESLSPPQKENPIPLISKSMFERILVGNHRSVLENLPEPTNVEIKFVKEGGYDVRYDYNVWKNRYGGTFTIVTSKGLVSDIIDNLNQRD